METRVLLECVRAAYEHARGLPVVPPDGFFVERRIGASGTDCEALLLAREADGRRVLAVPGTESWFDLRRDLDLFPRVRWAPFGRVHHGFADYARYVLAALDGRRPWIVTGHSLGGAVASLLAGSLRVQAVTFGCPRFAWCEPRIPGLWHYVHDDDAIARGLLQRMVGLVRPGVDIRLGSGGHGLDAYRRSVEALEG